MYETVADMSFRDNLHFDGISLDFVPLQSKLYVIFLSEDIFIRRWSPLKSSLLLSLLCFNLFIVVAGRFANFESRELFCRSEKESNRLVSRLRFPKSKKEFPQESFFELHNGTYMQH
jgi:uncharacterized membrane protein